MKMSHSSYTCFFEFKHKLLETGTMPSKQMGWSLFQAVRCVYMYIEQTSIPALEIGIYINLNFLHIFSDRLLMKL